MSSTRSPCDDDTGPGRILAPAGSNHYGDDVGEHRGGDGTEPRDSVFTPAYDYEHALDVPVDDWMRVFTRAGAGGRWKLPLARE